MIGRSGERWSQISLTQALLRLLHALDHLLAGHAAIEIVGIGQQAAFARNFFDVAGQHVVVQQARDDLLGGQALRNGELMRHHAALDDGRDDVAQAGMGLELIFAGLEILTRLEREHAANEDPGLIDNALAHQDIGDIADAGAARDIDDAILGQRPGRIETLLADDKRDGGHDRRQNEKLMMALPITTKGCRALLSGLVGMSTVSGSSAVRGLRGVRCLLLLMCRSPLINRLTKAE